MSLNIAHTRLGWPSPNEVRNPSGEGTRIFAALARAKIQNAISCRQDLQAVEIGVLSRNSEATRTEAPIAIVAEFSAKASDKSLRELLRLGWNFSHSPTVITIEPDLLRVWTCCEPPEADRFVGSYMVEEIAPSELEKTQPTNLAKRATQILHWTNLVSGQFFRDNANRFKRNRRADQMLLENLRYIRQRLQTAGLKDDDVCHDLLARVIFVQFLFDRKDSSGNSALSASKLASLHEGEVLNSPNHKNFADVLGNYDETYRLFDWLNAKFNGDLFPGKGKTAIEREQAWNEEKRHVKPKHLELLRDFVKGDLDMPSGQLCLWPQYAFDAIPLEFISSIYEAFVSERARNDGIYYTPPHLVDFMLDRVLPWDDTRWNLKVLDPACGSGVFLVKAFQRLIHRWKRKHVGKEIRAETLRGLLKNNLFGVDKDPHAVRVASFSLYLAMCDEIDPKHYWTQVHFPSMRGYRLINEDFFSESRNGFRTKADAGSYDLVIGNAPWGGDPLTLEARAWADRHHWPIAEKDIGVLFLPKSLSLTKQGGRVSMLQPARVLLFSQRGPAKEFRKRLFSEFKAEEVINLSALRFELFPHASDPACAVIFSTLPPDEDMICYISPKRSLADEDVSKIVVEPLDVQEIHSREAADDTLVWSALVWGGKRDLAFARQLSQLTNLERLEQKGVAKIRRGISRGDLGRRQTAIANRRILEADEFPEGTFFSLKASALPTNTDTRTHSRDSTNFDAFALPQMIVKQSWQKGHFRFQAAIVDSDVETGPVICSRSYASVHVSEANKQTLNAAWLCLRSKLAVYFLLLTSGRFAAYREEPNLEDILKVPIPPIEEFSEPLGVEEIDKIVRGAFSFKDAEWVLVEDLFNITLPDFKGDEASPGRRRTKRKVGSTKDPQLQCYCEYFIRVLKAGFGQDKSISATIFQEADKDPLPYRLIAFELDHASEEQIRVECLETSEILTELGALNETWLRQQKASLGSIYYQRVARLYDHRGNTPTIFILKPDAHRYWTRSIALHDADEVAADFTRWQKAGGGFPKHK